MVTKAWMAQELEVREAGILADYTRGSGQRWVGDRGHAAGVAGERAGLHGADEAAEGPCGELGQQRVREWDGEGGVGGGGGDARGDEESERGYGRVRLGSAAGECVEAAEVFDGEGRVARGWELVHGRSRRDAVGRGRRACDAVVGGRQEEVVQRSEPGGEPGGERAWGVGDGSRERARDVERGGRRR